MHESDIKQFLRKFDLFAALSNGNMTSASAFHQNEGHQRWKLCVQRRHRMSSVLVKASHSLAMLQIHANVWGIGLPMMVDTRCKKTQNVVCAQV